MSVRTLIIHTDGGSRQNPGPAAWGVSVCCDEFSGEERVGESSEPHLSEVESLSGFMGVATNNEAEYTALQTASINLATWVSRWQATRVIFRLDSQLVIEQVKGNWKVKQAHLVPFVQQIRSNLQQVRQSGVPVDLQYVPRAQNARADALVNLCLDAQVSS